MTSLTDLNEQLRELVRMERDRKEKEDQDRKDREQQAQDQLEATKATTAAAKARKEGEERVKSVSGWLQSIGSAPVAAMGAVENTSHLAGKTAKRLADFAKNKSESMAKNWSSMSKAGKVAGGAQISLAIIGAWASAMTEAGPALRQFGNNVLDANKRFAEAGAMFSVFSEKEMRDFRRNAQIGNSTAGSARQLMRARAKNEDAWAPITAGMQNIRNGIGIQGAKLEEWFINQWATPAMGVLTDIAKKLNLLVDKPEDTDTDTFPEWLNKAAEAGRVMRPQKPLP